MLFLIKLIRFYQKMAPKALRESCRFVPSCSEYMILAIEKYGCLKGIYKGFNRLLRCKVPNGGIDYP
jgi:putative membrane protein insertion efficiency factor